MTVSSITATAIFVSSVNEFRMAPPKQRQGKSRFRPRVQDLDHPVFLVLAFGLIGWALPGPWILQG